MVQLEMLPLTEFTVKETIHITIFARSINERICYRDNELKSCFENDSVVPYSTSAVYEVRQITTITAQFCAID